LYIQIIDMECISDGCAWDVCRYIFRSGNPEHPGDKFYNTSVQVLSSSHHSSTAAAAMSVPAECPLTEDHFCVVNHFNHDSGMAEGTLPAWLGPVDVLRLYVQYPSSSWAILNEVGCSCISRVQWHSTAFNALTVLLGGQEEHDPAHKNWVMRCCLEQRFTHGPADVTNTLPSLASLKSRMNLPFWCRLTQVVMENRPLNGCCASSSPVTFLQVLTALASWYNSECGARLDFQCRHVLHVYRDSHWWQCSAVSGTGCLVRTLTLNALHTHSNFHRRLKDKFQIFFSIPGKRLAGKSVSRILCWMGPQTLT